MQKSETIKEEQNKEELAYVKQSDLFDPCKTKDCIYKAKIGNEYCIKHDKNEKMVEWLK